MATDEVKAKPLEISEDAVKAAAEGKSEQVLGKSKPLRLSEDEVKLAAEGKSEQMIKRKEHERK